MDTHRVIVAVTLTNPGHRGVREPGSVSALTAAALRRELVEQAWSVGLYRAVAVEEVTDGPA